MFRARHAALSTFCWVGTASWTVRAMTSSSEIVLDSASVLFTRAIPLSSFRLTRHNFEET
jgi:hypothetical protein